MFWYYAINREMCDYGRVRGNAPLSESKPARSVVAVTAGSLVLIPWVVSLWRAVGRLEACERLAGARSGGSALVLCLLLGGSLVGWIGVLVASGVVAIVLAYAGVPTTIAATVLMQRRLTRLWGRVLS